MKPADAHLMLFWVYHLRRKSRQVLLTDNKDTRKKILEVVSHSTLRPELRSLKPPSLPFYLIVTFIYCSCLKSAQMYALLSAKKRQSNREKEAGNG